MAGTRRDFIASGAAVALNAGGQPVGPQSMLDVDFRALVSRGDLVYDKPAPTSEEGIPVGNGRMGTLVWTTPSELRMQVNRADVYPISCTSNSFNERNTDFCGGCGFLDVDFGGVEVFPLSGFDQRLSLYEGKLAVRGRGADCQLVVWPQGDVLALSIDAPGGFAVNLRMLRFDSRSPGPSNPHRRVNVFRHRSHSSTSALSIDNSRILLEQEFREGKHCCKSAVAVVGSGRDAKAGFSGETGVRLSVPPGSGPVTVLIASAATFDAGANVADLALKQLEAGRAKGFTSIAAETAEWWREYWSRGFVHLQSADGAAMFVQQHYTYFLYLMAASSRGKFPPKFNGMLWNTGGDFRTWGAQHWYANLSCYYEPLPAANRIDLMDPMFDMYSGAHEACSKAAHQQWGSRGAYIPETMYFDGLEDLPQDIAAEMRELYLTRKAWPERSQRFIELSQHKMPHSSRWNWIAKGEWIDGRFVETERGAGPFGAVNHILGTSAKIPYLFWRRYEYTLDREWLRTRAYPMIKAAAEFYRYFPNLKKGTDGRYHIYFVNSNESVWGGTDTDEDLSAMRGILAVAIRASNILTVDEELRGRWTELRDNLTSLPSSDHPDALKNAAYSGPPVWVRSLKPVVRGESMLPDGNSLPAWFFDLCNLESRDARALETANHTLNAILRNPPGPQTPVGLLSKVPMAAATLGRGEAVRFLIPNQMRGLLRPPAEGTANLRNRMSLREGRQALDAEALGRASEALHLALMQSNPPGPGEDPVIRLFPAWPKGWDAAFKLLARGALLVSSSVRGDRIEFVELRSLAGSRCRLRNPWGEGQVTLYRNGRKAESLAASLLEFGTSSGEHIVVVPGSAQPSPLARRI